MNLNGSTIDVYELISNLTNLMPSDTVRDHFTSYMAVTKSTLQSRSWANIVYIGEKWPILNIANSVG